MGFERTKCDLCGANNPQLIFEGKDRLHKLPGTFPVVMCRECQLVYVNPRPDQKTLAEYYPDDYSPFDQGHGFIGRLKKLLRTAEAKRIRRHLPSQGRVLEVGCAAGDLLVPLRECGLRVFGIEMSPHAASMARESCGLTVHTGTLFSADFEERSFDAVVMRHVIEHFPSARLALERVSRFVKPGGLLFITTPNHNSLDRKVFGRFWHNYEPPRHMVVFSVDTLSRLIVGAGFELKRVSYSSLPNDWIHSLRYVVEEKFGEGCLSRFFSIENILLLFLFLPFGLAGKLMSGSGRISIIAVRRL